MSQKILIVDDDAELLRVMSLTLQRGGYHPVTAPNAEIALEKIRSERPALVILDVMLPRHSGIELCQLLRNDPATATLPIIMLSARTQVDEKIEGLEAGADEYLTKPISPKELNARVKALLERTERLQSHQGVTGQVLGFMGVKGGVGTTTLALNVGATLARRGKKVIAVELRPNYGTFDIHLGYKPQERLHRLWQRANGRFSSQVVRASLLTDESGMEVLYGPEMPDQWLEITAEEAVSLVTTLAQMAEFVLLDLPAPGLGFTQAVLAHCDRLMMVLRPELDSLASASISLEQLKREGIELGRVEAIVVNQAPLAMGLSVSKVTEQLACKVRSVIPPAADVCANAMKKGRPLVITHPDTGAATRVRELSAYLMKKE